MACWHLLSSGRGQTTAPEVQILVRTDLSPTPDVSTGCSAARQRGLVHVRQESSWWLGHRSRERAPGNFILKSITYALVGSDVETRFSSHVYTSSKEWLKRMAPLKDKAGKGTLILGGAIIVIVFIFLGLFAFLHTYPPAAYPPPPIETTVSTPTISQTQPANNPTNLTPTTQSTTETKTSTLASTSSQATSSPTTTVTSATTETSTATTPATVVSTQTFTSQTSHTTTTSPISSSTSPSQNGGTQPVVTTSTVTTSSTTTSTITTSSTTTTSQTSTPPGTSVPEFSASMAAAVAVAFVALAALRKSKSFLEVH